MSVSSYGVALRAAVVVAIVALSPLPLTIPSGVALAMIGLLGAVVLIRQTRQPMADACSPAAPSRTPFRLGGTTSLLIPGRLLPRPADAGTVKVDRPTVPWRATSVLTMPLEVLAVAWAVPVVILLVMTPVGLIIAAALWAGRMILGL